MPVALRTGGEPFTADNVVPFVRPRFGNADRVLELLRDGSPEALARAEAMMGKPVTKCPSGMPPYPPLPVKTKCTLPRLADFLPNPCSKATDAYKRYAKLRRGKTAEQLLRTGVTKRDLSVWRKRGWITWTK